MWYVSSTSRVGGGEGREDLAELRQHHNILKKRCTHTTTCIGRIWSIASRTQRLLVSAFTLNASSVCPAQGQSGWSFGSSVCLAGDNRSPLPA